MNVLMHTSTGFALAVLVIDKNKHESKIISRLILRRSFIAFFAGIILHGILDYIPHCYPINSKIDVIASFVLMVIAILLSNKKYKLIIAASFAGNIFPDLLDLSLGIINQYLHLNVPIFPKISPWHWPKYSGSIYDGDCNVSNLNHLMIITLILLICILKREKLQSIFRKQ